MKYLIFLLAFSANANQVSYKHMFLDQVVTNEVKFTQPLHAIEYSKLIYRDFGLKATISKSGDYETSGDYENKIKLLQHYQVFYRYNIDNFDVDLELGYVDYKALWKYKGYKPTWHKDTDVSLSYGVTVNYRLDDNYSVFFGYTDLYRDKEKSQEKTKSFNLGLTYSF